MCFLVVFFDDEEDRLPPRDTSPHQDSTGTAPSGTAPQAQPLPPQLESVTQHPSDPPWRTERVGMGWARSRIPAETDAGSALAFTRFCHDQHCMVYGIHKGGSEGVRVLRNSRAIVMQ